MKRIQILGDTKKMGSLEQVEADLREMDERAAEVAAAEAAAAEDAARQQELAKRSNKKLMKI